MKKSKKFTSLKDVVYSTNPDFQYELIENKEDSETLPPEQQKLVVCIDKKKRQGKVVTLVSGFVGSEDDLKELSKLLKTKCGTGGSAKDGEIIIQGEWKEKIAQILTENNYKVKIK